MAAYKKYWLGPVIFVIVVLGVLLVFGRNETGEPLFQYKLF